MMAAVPALATYLRTRSPAILHSPGNHTTRAAAFAVALAGFGGAFVAKVTNRLIDDRMARHRRWFRRSSFRWALSKAQLVLVIAPSQAAELVGIDARLGGRIRFVHNPYVEEGMIRAASRRRPAEPPVILSIGRLSEQKNHELLLRASAQLGDRPWRLRICGTGPEEARLRVVADELGIAGRLELPGYVGDPVPEYQAATVMVLPSRWEGVPATVLEAISCGCPVVATASSPGLVELLRQVGAREPVASGDSAGLAEALRVALDGELPAVPPEAALPYGIEAACDEHAALFAGLIREGGLGDIPGSAGR